LGSEAGERPIVIRCCGHCSPLFTTAARIRSRASRNAVSGNPTSVIPGSPFAISVSMVMMWPLTPVSVTE